MRLTKLLPPTAVAGGVARPRLEGIADRMLEVPAALVTGGGGFGKSTLLATWFTRLGSRARVAWLAIEPQDASLTALAEAFQQAAQHAIPELGDSVRRLLDEGCRDVAPYASALVNELFVVTEDLGVHLVLFVDDVHHVCDDPDGALAFLSAFLTGLPPRVHLALASRRALSFPPLAKLRNAGRLVEVDEAALRFRPDEASALVGDARMAERLVERTEGWAIAVRLTAALAPSHGGDLDEMLGSAGESVFRFLAEEVVSSLPAETRAQLHALALPTSVDPATANVLLEREDGAAILDALTQRGLYLTVDRRGQRRFHHLFREFLLHRFRLEDPAGERELRRRYAVLLRERGEKLEALGQLIEAGAYLDVVEYVQEALMTIRFTDRFRALLDLLAQVPEAVKRQKPMLYRLHAMALQRCGLLRDSDEQLARCYDAALAAGDDATACMALLELGVGSDDFRFQGHGEFRRSEGYFRRALELARSRELRGRTGYRRLAHYFLGMALAARYAYGEALRHLSAAERLELEEGRHGELILVGEALAFGWMGEWRRSLECAEHAEELFRNGAEFQLGHAWLAQARAQLALREDAARARELCAQAVEAFRAAQQQDELGGAYLTMLRALLAADPPDLAGAAAACDEAARALDPRDPVARFELAFARAEIAAASGETDVVEARLADAAAIARRSGDRRRAALVTLAEARSRTARGQDEEAAALFGEAAERFAGVGDRHHRALARLEWAASGARRGTLTAEALGETQVQLETQHLEHVANAAPRAAGALLAWALRHGVEVERAERLFGGFVADDEEVAAVALDASLPAPGRAAAVRLLAKGAQGSCRALIVKLTKDGDALVSSTATAVLNLLPAGDAPQLRVSVVGELRVQVGGVTFSERDPRFSRKKAAELLKYLALAGSPVSRRSAIEALWPDGGSGADVTLRVTLHALRRALQPADEGVGEYVEIRGSSIALNRERFAGTDAETALANVRRGTYLLARRELDEARAALESAVELLEGAQREAEVPEWMGVHARRWRSAYAEAQRSLAAVHAATGRSDAALEAALRALAYDPLDEESVALLLDLYGARGDVEEGRALFSRYKHRLSEALSLSPSRELVERYSRLLARRVESERRGLSERELEVLRLVAQGRSNKEIASALSLSPWTVNNHMARILRKLNVENRAAAVSIAGSVLGGIEREGR
ncbi:MAG TPA: LuxR C-terminal-related transcriptional regulator [Candidatus Dormibacteraeota bacterium]|nr:LuxR C-terminal-related transcriptional regulator [Candidatus Dormibacteraeota bacterium]